MNIDEHKTCGRIISRLENKNIQLTADMLILKKQLQRLTDSIIIDTKKNVVVQWE